MVFPDESEILSHSIRFFWNIDEDDAWPRLYIYELNSSFCGQHFPLSAILLWLCNGKWNSLNSFISKYIFVSWLTSSTSLFN